jgi:hypothetical protein
VQPGAPGAGLVHAGRLDSTAGRTLNGVDLKRGLLGIDHVGRLGFSGHSKFYNLLSISCRYSRSSSACARCISTSRETWLPSAMAAINALFRRTIRAFRTRARLGGGDVFSVVIISMGIFKFVNKPDRQGQTAQGNYQGSDGRQWLPEIGDGPSVFIHDSSVGGK